MIATIATTILMVSDFMAAKSARASSAVQCSAVQCSAVQCETQLATSVSVQCSHDARTPARCTRVLLTMHLLQ